MATLQTESDTAFQDAVTRTVQQELAAERASRKPGAVQFADEDQGADAYPAPEPLSADDQGLKRPGESVQFADTGEAAGILADEQALEQPESPVGEGPQKQPRDLDDIHAVDAPSDGRRAKSADAEEEFDPSILARARNYGLPEDQIRATYKSREQLETALLAIDQQGLNQYRWWKQQQQWQQQQPPPVAQPPAPVPGTPQPTAEEDLYQLSDPDVYDETLAKDLQGLSKFASDKFKRQSEEVSRLATMVAQQQQQMEVWQQRQLQEVQQREFVDFEKTIRSLGPAWEEVFGTEEHTALPQNDPRLVNRAKAWETAKELQLFHVASNRRYMSLTDVLPSSLGLTFPDRQAVASASTRDTRARDSRGRYLAVPSGRQRPGQHNAREETLRRADRFFAQRGLPGDYGVEGGYEQV